MNDIAMAELTRNAVRKKFRGNKKLNCKVLVRYKENLEREYKRITNAYIRLLKESINLYYGEIQNAYKAEKTSYREEHADDTKTLLTVVRDAFDKMGVALEKKIGTFALEKKIDKLANLTKKLSIKEWKKVVHATLGVDITEDYYMGEFYREALTRWTSENVNLIKTIPMDTLGDMKMIVQADFISGKSITEVMKDLQNAYHLTRSKARFLARDQIAKLNSQVTKMQHEAAGVSEYVWSDSGDGRVRDRHRELNGKTFKWSDPPVVDKKTGRRAHPGQDYQCRCIALPKFDIDTITLPISGK